eukprot:2155418-Prymnesium_polylepis.2
MRCDDRSSAARGGGGGGGAPPEPPSCSDASLAAAISSSSRDQNSRTLVERTASDAADSAWSSRNANQTTCEPTTHAGRPCTTQSIVKSAAPGMRPRAASRRTSSAA